MAEPAATSKCPVRLDASSHRRIVGLEATRSIFGLKASPDSKHHRAQCITGLNASPGSKHHPASRIAKLDRIALATRATAPACASPTRTTVSRGLIDHRIRPNPRSPPPTQPWRPASEVLATTTCRYVRRWITANSAPDSAASTACNGYAMATNPQICRLL